ncbi:MULTISPECIES: TetR/AcrR family transcriptional regulator [Pontibacter]|uniref:Transcriptional regulator, TetR family n=1 Tax=Pontibacter lucknowensis TaxID=1077936 RepID=A0A1N6WQF9_9BACT|nr:MULTISPECIES: TetR/AcrR family transcriptional regulator [Pontibacter]EJF07963.1 TetR family transcriptional regulator [Pontibacter sp. BAB1700]SIQ92298.1 transcriptional regulator, TetR family [Pontibacter lucknowensis]
MTRFQERREHSINRLVEVALRLFASQGYEATSIRSIAKEAGMSLGLLYNYFKSKDELLAEIFRRGVEDIHASFEPASEQAGSGIAQHIQQTVKLLKEKKDFWKLLHGIRMQSEVVRQLLHDMQEETAYIEERIRQNLMEAGIPFPELEAKLLFASIDGMANHFLFYDNYPIDDVASLLIMKYKK